MEDFLSKILQKYMNFDTGTITDTNKKVITRGTRWIEQNKTLLNMPVIKNSERIVVRRRQLPYWMENGWKQVSTDYIGYYQTKYGRWRGEIQHEYGGHYKYIISNPPKKLMKHSHSACFREQDNNGTYWVHFSKLPKDIDSGIISIEMILTEACEIYW